jgi:hypothetical protein
MLPIWAAFLCGYPLLPYFPKRFYISNSILLWIMATTFHCPLNRLYAREHGEHKDTDSVSVVVPSRIRVLYF